MAIERDHPAYDRLHIRPRGRRRLASSSPRTNAFSRSLLKLGASLRNRAMPLIEAAARKRPARRAFALTPRI
jgi:hypothetical protein